jgi:hypothetical protein
MAVTTNTFDLDIIRVNLGGGGFVYDEVIAFATASQIATVEELPPAEVIEWLHTKEGEEWSESHTRRVRRWSGGHWAGVFGGIENQKSLGDWTHQYTPEPDAYLRMGGYIKELGDRYIYEPETVKGLCSPA